MRRPIVVKLTATLYVNEFNLLNITDNANGTFTIAYRDNVGAIVTTIVTATISDIAEVFKIIPLV